MLIDSAALKAVMESPVPVASLTIVCFLAWRQMNLVNKTVTKVIDTMSGLLSNFQKDFKASSEKVMASENKLTVELIKTNMTVEEFGKKLSQMPTLIQDKLEDKLSHLPTTGAAIEARLKKIEAEREIDSRNLKALIEALRKKQEQNKS